MRRCIASAAGFALRGVRAPGMTWKPETRMYCTEAGSTGRGEVTRTEDGERTKMNTNDFFVGGGSSVNKLAGACAHALRDFDSAGMRAIGPRAVNQAIKATAVCRTFLSRDSKGLIVRIENARVVSYERTTQTLPKLGAHILLYNNEDIIEVQEREDERILTVAARTLPRNLAAAIKVWKTEGRG